MKADRKRTRRSEIPFRATERTLKVFEILAVEHFDWHTYMIGENIDENSFIFNEGLIRIARLWKLQFWKQGWNENA